MNTIDFKIIVGENVYILLNLRVSGVRTLGLRRRPVRWMGWWMVGFGSSGTRASRI